MEENNKKEKMSRKQKYFIAYTVVIILAICMTFFIVEQRKYNRSKQNNSREVEDKANQDSYNNEIANQYNHEEPSTTTPKEEPTEEPKEPEKSEEQIYREELRKKYESVRNINNDILSKLEKNNFKKIKNPKHCYSDDYCYSDGYMEVEADPSNAYIYFYATSKREDRNTYDVKKDLSILANVYDRQSILSFADGINKLIRQYSDSILIETDLSRLDIFLSYDYIEYSLSYPIFYEDLSLRPTYVDSIIYDTKNGKEKRDFYDLSMMNNSKYFAFYDYVYNHIENDNVCAINLFDESGYAFYSDYCHAGTSNINFHFTYYTTNPDYKSVFVDVKGVYFKEFYESFIKKDLEYFNNKLNTKYELSKKNLEELDYFVINKQPKLSLTIDDKFIIDIQYFDSYHYKNYRITYKFKK